MTNIVAIKAAPGDPDAEVVAILEDLLACAKSGELRAVAYATVSEGSNTGTGWEGAGGTKHALAFSIMMLSHRYPAAVLEG